MHLKPSGNPEPAGQDSELSLLETDGDWAVVLCSRPFPIGATLAFIATGEGAAEAAAVPTSVEYRIKVRAARRHDDGRYRVEGRLVSMTKEQRELLLGTLPRR